MYELVAFELRKVELLHYTVSMALETQLYRQLCSAVK